MENYDQKSEAPTPGRTQDSATEYLHDPTGQGSSGSTNRIDGAKPGGIHGEPGPWGDSVSGAVLGKLISQLIEAEEEQLEESRQCVAWYGEQIARTERRLSQLRDLATLRLEQDQQEN